MKVVLMGLPGSGKTTIFSALTGMNIDPSSYSGKSGEPPRAVVKVPDERLQTLSAMYRPRKTTPAVVEMVDVTRGLEEEGSGLWSPSELVQMRMADALCVVLRNFPDPLGAEADPVKDLSQIEEEMILSDSILVENRLDRIAAAKKRGQKSQDIAAEERFLSEFRDHLLEGKPLRSSETPPTGDLRGFGFLTQKPLMVLVNSSEDSFGKNPGLLSRLNERYPSEECAGLFERDLATMEDEEDRQMFMDDLNISVSAKDRAVRLIFETVGYISFFTVGPDEVRAWNLRRGLTAKDAAGTIHSDLARGFIRAECFRYEDLVELGSERSIREKGKFRLEGKDYIVQDGDILSIRFSV
ncbi:MAG TPA: DUF933 domain-containing protein [Thermoanaerobaculia bacterium]|nr:DUF933 domain-containing protein [Thermoanaerobaculia bacterium]HUM28662.1 DUF933 domain-containing protein [Thermoanaerobaculia bacterium]HXK66730.1 DUF933 domain-containing protein [Thermoanaerobaculia bacterium]